MADHPITHSPAELVEQWLCNRTKSQFSKVLQARSDIAIPQPNDLHTLAHRLLLPASLARALEQCNSIELAVIEALLAAGAHTKPVTHTKLVTELADTQLRHAHQKQLSLADASAPDTRSSAGVDKPAQNSEDTGPDLLSQVLLHLHDRALVFPYPVAKNSSAADTDGTTQQLWVPTRINTLLNQRDRLLHQPSLPSDVVDKLPAKHQEILRRIHAGGGLGTTKHAQSTDPEHPITQMIRAGVLRVVADSTVALPITVNRILSGLPATDVQLLPSSRISSRLWDDDAACLAHYLSAPKPSFSESAQDSTDASATAAGLEACRAVSSLLEYLGTSPVPMLKNGGLGQRSSKLLAQQLDFTTANVYRTVALAYSAGLLGTGEPKPLPAAGEGNYLAPTRRADDWQESDLATRWAMLLRGWINSPWAWWILLPDTSSTTAQSSRADGHHRLLHPEFSQHRLAFSRRLVLQGLARSSAQGSVSEPELWQDLLFLYPKLITPHSQVHLTPLLREAEWVGAISKGRLSRPAVALLADDYAENSAPSAAQLDPQDQKTSGTEDPDDAVVVATRELCPTAISEFIVQADFTIMCPGPLENAVRTELELIADLKSSGLASLYRIAESSIRRGLDAGRSGEQIINFLQAHSLTPVPDSIISVTHELARHHGGLRTGPAVSYLRCEDPETLDLLEHSAVAAEIAVHRIAPTVLISQKPVASVVQLLSEHSFYAVAEDSNGHGVDIRNSPARVPQPRIKAASAPRADATRIASLVDKLWTGDGGASATSSADEVTSASSNSLQGSTESTTSTTSPTQAPVAPTPMSPMSATSTAEISNTVEFAQRSGRTVTVGYANKSGQRQQVRATVLSIFGGNVDISVAEDGAVRRIPLHRIVDIASSD